MTTIENLHMLLYRRCRMGKILGITAENQGILDEARRGVSLLNCRVYEKKDKKVLAAAKLEEQQ